MSHIALVQICDTIFPVDFKSSTPTQEVDK